MRNATKRGRVAALVVAGLIVAPVIAATPGVAATHKAVAAKSLHRFDGKITSINNIGHKFRMHDHHRGKVLIKANGKTRYKGLRNFRDLFEGMRVEVKAHGKNGRWIANKIERRGPPISPP
ncbi:MAG: hypothetical protein ACM3NS_07800 [Deltaproteobacteria bacterium]